MAVCELCNHPRFTTKLFWVCAKCQEAAKGACGCDSVHEVVHVRPKFKPARWLGVVGLLMGSMLAETLILVLT